MAYRVWVTIPNDSARSGYLAKDAREHHPATAQTIQWSRGGATFETWTEAEEAISVRGWVNETGVRPGRVTAYVVEAL